MSALCQKRTHPLQQTSGRAFPVVSIVYLSIECPFDKFYGVNCRLKLGAKLLDRFFHGRRHLVAAGIVWGLPTIYPLSKERAFGGFREISVPEWDREFRLVRVRHE